MDSTVVSCLAGARHTDLMGPRARDCIGPISTASRNPGGPDVICLLDRRIIHSHPIDAQHETLIEIINKQYDAMQKGKANEVMRKIPADPSDYTVTHFSHEERLFRTHAYPDTAPHQNPYSNLVAQIKELQRQLDGGQPISIRTFSFLKKWLSEHIMKDDQNYSPLLRAKGVR